MNSSHTEPGSIVFSSWLSTSFPSNSSFFCSFLSPFLGELWHQSTLSSPFTECSVVETCPCTEEPLPSKRHVFDKGEEAADVGSTFLDGRAETWRKSLKQVKFFLYSLILRAFKMGKKLSCRLLRPKSTFSLQNFRPTSPATSRFFWKLSLAKNFSNLWSSWMCSFRGSLSALEIFSSDCLLSSSTKLLASRTKSARCCSRTYCYWLLELDVRLEDCCFLTTSPF